VLFRERQRRTQLVRAFSDADGEDRFYTRLASTRQHFLSVRIKLLEIQVRVRINQIHSQIYCQPDDRPRA
jgi:hypothetical protein